MPKIWRRRASWVGEQGLGDVSRGASVSIKLIARLNNGVLRRLADVCVIRWANMLFVLQVTNKDVDFESR